MTETLPTGPFYTAPHPNRELDITERLQLMEGGKAGPYPRDETLWVAREAIESLRANIKSVREAKRAAELIADIAMTEEQLAYKIERAIADIPANNPAYISVRQQTLSDVMSYDLIRKIAKVAAAAART